MTDIADVKTPHGMKVGKIQFKATYTQIRNGFGYGYLEFDEEGKIKTVEFINGTYSQSPKDEAAWLESIKTFTGPIEDLDDVGLVLYKGQLIYEFGIMYPYATEVFYRVYDTNRITHPKGGCMQSLEGEEAEQFKAVVDHYLKGLNSTAEKLELKDLFLFDSPLLRPGIDAYLSQQLEWAEVMRKLYQTGEVPNDSEFSYLNDPKTFQNVLSWELPNGKILNY